MAQATIAGAQAEPQTSSASAELRITGDRDKTARVIVGGAWSVRVERARLDTILEPLERDPSIRRVEFDSSSVSDWDSSLLVFASRVIEAAQARNITVVSDGLPDGLKRLLALASAVPEKATKRSAKRTPLVARAGSWAIEAVSAAAATVRFIGETVIALGRLVRGKARYRRVDFAEAIQQSGAEALGIVSLISFLVGLILAFVGAIQLQKFGAEIYVADLVGIAMAREMGAMMTAIVMAGRTGAAFAAQLGTMMVNEEVDALETMAISPIEFLVMPRMLALALMMPLLCVYADLVGIAGGAVVSVGMLDISLTQYLQQTKGAVTLTHIAIGLIKSIVFGVIVAVSGCLRGMQCGRSASAVGDATTSAVVTAIVWIIVADAIFAVLTNILNV